MFVVNIVQLSSIRFEVLVDEPVWVEFEESG
jgi:hypothetical protein